MRTYEVANCAAFLAALPKLTREIRQQAKKAYRHFRTNPAHPGLHFHRLETHPELWSVRVTRDYGAVGWLSGDTITWFWIGTHEEFDHTF